MCFPTIIALSSCIFINVLTCVKSIFAQKSRCKSGCVKTKRCNYHKSARNLVISMNEKFVNRRKKTKPRSKCNYCFQLYYLTFNPCTQCTIIAFNRVIIQFHYFKIGFHFMKSRHEFYFQFKAIINMYRHRPSLQ